MSWLKRSHISLTADIIQILAFLGLSLTGLWFWPQHHQMWFLFAVVVILVVGICLFILRIQKSRRGIFAQLIPEDKVIDKKFRLFNDVVRKWDKDAKLLGFSMEFTIYPGHTDLFDFYYSLEAYSNWRKEWIKVYFDSTRYYSDEDSADIYFLSKEKSQPDKYKYMGVNKPFHKRYKKWRKLLSAQFEEIADKAEEIISVDVSDEYVNAIPALEIFICTGKQLSNITKRYYNKNGRVIEHRD